MHLQRDCAIVSAGLDTHQDYSVAVRFALLLFVNEACCLWVCRDSLSSYVRRGEDQVRVTVTCSLPYDGMVLLGRMMRLALRVDNKV